MLEPWYLLIYFERFFEAYQVYSLFFFDSDISYFTSVSTATLLLALSMNKQLFMILRDDILYKYKNVYFTVCPAAIVIYEWRPQHCLVALYCGKVTLQEK
jgi:hypothetical protein